VKTPAAPRVLMVVATDVTVDARVQKSASTLANAGCDVEVLFHAKRERDFPSHLGAVRIEHVPTSFTHIPHGWSNLVGDLRRTLRTRGGYASLQRRRRAVHRRKLDERRAAARIAVRKLELIRLNERSMSAVIDRAARKARTRALTSAIRADRFRLRAWRRVQRARIARSEAPGKREEFPLQPATEMTNQDLRLDWRRGLADLADLELSFGARIDVLRPDVIHVHDFHLLPAAVEAAARAAVGRRRVPVIYDAHEYVRGLTTLRDERRRALAAMEARFLPSVDAIITVSPALAERLVADHGCAQPTVVLNAPYRSAPTSRASRSLREEAGVDRSARLLVYSGNVTPARGVHTLVDAIPHLADDVQVVLVVGDRVPYLDLLLDRAARLGVVDRLRLAPYVPADEVPAYLSEADAGVHPLRRYPNGEIALPNKLFEYVQAGIPVIVSDCRAQGAFVRDHGIGEVFRADDPWSLAKAAMTVLADRERYCAPIGPEQRAALSWEGQEPALLEVYRRFISLPADDGTPAAGSCASCHVAAPDELERDPPPPLPN
jgi:glycosyltransferase involved in cell wall biosynthesis